MSLFDRVFRKPSKTMVTPASGAGWTYDEKAICRIEDIPVEFAASPDASRVALILDRADYWQVVIDGQSSERWNAVKQGCLVFSPDSTRVVYAAERQGKSIVVLDGDVLWGYGELTSKPVFSSDSKHCAFVTRHNRGQRLVVDGKTGRLCEAIGDDDPIFSPASDCLAYTEISSRGCSVAVVADLKEPTLVTAGEPFDGIAGGTPIFSPDGKRIAYIAGKDGRFIVVIDGENSVPYDGIVKGSLCFSPDSKHCAYAARRSGKALVIVNGKVVSEHEGVFMLQFGSGHSGFSYLAKTRDHWVWIKNNGRVCEVPGGEEVTVTVAEDLSHIAYVFKEDDQQVLVLDERHVYRNPEIVCLVFSPDSTRLACVARHPLTRQGSVVVDGVSGPHFNGIVKPGIVFSPDSRHLFYTARLSSGEESLVVNHDVMCAFYEVFKTAEFYFPDNASVRLVIVKEGGTVTQVTAHPA